MPQQWLLAPLLSVRTTRIALMNLCAWAQKEYISHRKNIPNVEVDEIAGISGQAT